MPPFLSHWFRCYLVEFLVRALDMFFPSEDPPFKEHVPEMHDEGRNENHSQIGWPGSESHNRMYVDQEAVRETEMKKKANIRIRLGQNINE